MPKNKRQTHEQRIAILENRVDWVVHEAFQTLANSVAEQASACQAVLKVLADLHPDRRMVKCATEDGRVFYEFKTIEEIEAQAAARAKQPDGVQAEILEAKPDAKDE